MAKKFNQSFEIDATPEKLLETLIDPEFQVAREKAQGALECTVKDVDRSDARFVYECHVKEYARGMTGIDKSKTEINVTTYTWDLKGKSCTWDYKSPQGDRVKVNGSLRIEAKGGKSILHDEFSVEIKIPLMGKKIEGIVGKEVEKGQPTFQRVVREWATK